MSNRNELEEAIRETGGTIESDGKIRGGNLVRVADKLGVARKTLYNRMKEHGLKGRSGRPKIGYKRRSRNYATAAVLGTAVLVGGAVLLGRKSPKTFTPT